jgi:hypothetical protein
MNPWWGHPNHIQASRQFMCEEYNLETPHLGAGSCYSPEPAPHSLECGPRMVRSSNLPEKGKNLDSYNFFWGHNLNIFKNTKSAKTKHIHIYGSPLDLAEVSSNLWFSLLSLVYSLAYWDGATVLLMQSHRIVHSPVFDTPVRSEGPGPCQ